MADPVINPLEERRRKAQEWADTFGVDTSDMATDKAISTEPPLSPETETALLEGPIPSYPKLEEQGIYPDAREARRKVALKLLKEGYSKEDVDRLKLVSSEGVKEIGTEIDKALSTRPAGEYTRPEVPTTPQKSRMSVAGMVDIEEAREAAKPYIQKQKEWDAEIVQEKQQTHSALGLARDVVLPIVEFHGRIGFDETKVKRMIEPKIREEISQELYGTKYEALAPLLARKTGKLEQDLTDEDRTRIGTWYKEINDEVDRRSEALIRAVESQNRRLTMIDTDPEKTNEELAEWSGIPIFAGISPRDIATVMAPKAYKISHPSKEGFITEDIIPETIHGDYLSRIAFDMMQAVVATRIKRIGQSDAKLIGGRIADAASSFAAVPGQALQGQGKAAIDKYAADIQSIGDSYVAGFAAAYGTTPELARANVELMRTNPAMRGILADDYEDFGAQIIEDGLGREATEGERKWLRHTGSFHGFITGDIVMLDPATLSTAGIGMVGKQVTIWNAVSNADEFIDTAKILKNTPDATFESGEKALRAINPAMADQVVWEYEIAVAAEAAVSPVYGKLKQDYVWALDEYRAMLDEAGIVAGREPDMERAAKIEAARKKTDQLRKEVELADAQERIAIAEQAVADYESVNSPYRKQAAWYTKNGSRLEAEAVAAKTDADTFYMGNKVEIDSVAPAVLQDQAAQKAYADAQRALEKGRSELRTLMGHRPSITDPAELARIDAEIQRRAADLSQLDSVANSARTSARASSATIRTLDKAHIAKAKEWGRKLERWFATQSRIDAGKAWFHNMTGKTMDDWAQADDAMRFILHGEVDNAALAFERVVAQHGGTVAARQTLEGIAAQARAIGHKGLVAARKKEVAEAWRNIALGIGLRYRRGLYANMRLEMKAEQTIAKRGDILKTATEKINKDGTRTINSTKFILDLEKEIGRGGIEFLKKQPTELGALLTRLDNTVDVTRTKPFMNHYGPGERPPGESAQVIADTVELDPKSVSLLQNAQYEYNAGRLAGDAQYGDVATFLNIEGRKGESYLNSPKTWQQTIISKVKRFSNLFNGEYPIRSKLMALSSRIPETAKVAVNLSTQVEAELVSFSTTGKWEDVSPETREILHRLGIDPGDTSRVADETAPAERGATDGAEDMEGGEERVDRLAQTTTDTVQPAPKRSSIRELISDEGPGLPRAPANPRAAIEVGLIIDYLDSNRALPHLGGSTMMNTVSRQGDTMWQVARRQMIYDSRMPEFIKEASTVRSAQELDKLALRYNDTLAPHIVGLSRVWLPSEMGGHSQELANALLKFTMEELERNFQGGGTFVDFMIALRKRTQNLPAHLRVKGADEAGNAITGPGMRAASAGAGKADVNVVRVFGFAGKLVGHATVVADVDKYITKVLGGVIDTDTAADMSAILSGQRLVNITGDERAIQRAKEAGTLQAGKAGGPQYRKIDPRRVEQGFVQLGIPYARDLHKMHDSMNRAVEATMGIQRLSDDIALPPWGTTPLVKHVDGLIGNVVKQLEGHTVNVDVGNPKAVLDIAATVWRRGITVGWLLPRPSFWVNNYFGNIYQTWTEYGIAPASQTAFQGVWSNIPIIGKHMERWLSTMAAKHGDKPVIGPIFNTLMNPYSAGVFSGAKGYVKTVTGVIFSYDDARRWLVEDGILDTMIHDDFSTIFARYKDTWVGRLVQGELPYHRGPSNFATYTQQRGRANFYLQQLKDGYSREAAKKRTLSAFYDWKNDVPAMIQYMRWLPFGRFMAHAHKQTFNALIDGFVHPEEAFGRALVGQSKLGNVRAQKALIESSWGVLRSEDKEHHADAGDQQDSMATYLPPGYVDKRLALGIYRNGDDMWRQYFMDSGKYKSHQMFSLPGSTQLDFLDLQFGLSAAAITGMIAESKNFMGIHNQTQEIPGQRAEAGILLIDQMMPSYSEPIKAILEKYDIIPGGFGGMSYITPEQEYTAKMLGMETFHTEDGKPTTSGVAASILTNSPVMSEIVKAVSVTATSPYSSLPDNDRQWLYRNTAYALGKYFGVRVDFNPDDTLYPWRKAAAFQADKLSGSPTLDPKHSGFSPMNNPDYGTPIRHPVDREGEAE